MIRSQLKARLVEKRSISFPLAYETYGKLNENKDNAVLGFSRALTGEINLWQEQTL